MVERDFEQKFYCRTYKRSSPNLAFSVDHILMNKLTSISHEVIRKS